MLVADQPVVPGGVQKRAAVVQRIEHEHVAEEPGGAPQGALIFQQDHCAPAARRSGERSNLVIARHPLTDWRARGIVANVLQHANVFGAVNGQLEQRVHRLGRRQVGQPAHPHSSPARRPL